MISVTVVTKLNVCCDQAVFVNCAPYNYGPCGAGEGYIGKCAICGKDWEIDASTIKTVNKPFTLKQYDSGIIGSNATVGDLINILQQFDLHTPIDHIRINGADNVLYSESCENGLLIND